MLRQTMTKLSVLFLAMVTGLMLAASPAALPTTPEPVLASEVASYNSEWLMTASRRFLYGKSDCRRSYNRDASVPKDSPIASDRLCGWVDVGPSIWRTMSCINGTYQAGDENRLGRCSKSGPDTYKVNETWTATHWNATFPARACCEIKFSMWGTDAHAIAGEVLSAAVFTEGGCEDQGYLFRSGLYGVFWTTSEGCDDNTAGSWWAWSELPVRWTVTGSVTRCTVDNCSR